MATTPAEAKEKGNTAFKAGSYDLAIGHYTRAVILSQQLSSPVDPTFYLNRAAAYLKLNKYEDAARDCTSALGLRGGDVKALFRRAQARMGLGEHSGARADLEEALKIEPNNQAVKDLLQTLPVKQAAKPKASPLASAVKERTPPSAPAVASTSGAGKPKRRRIPITLVDEPSSTPLITPSSSSSSSSKGAAAQTPLKSALKSPAATASLPVVPTPPAAGAGAGAGAAASSTPPELLTAVSSTRLTPSSSSLGSSSSSTPALTTPPRSTSSPSSGAGQPSTFAAAREAREARDARRVGGGVFRKDGTARLIGSDGSALLTSGAEGEGEGQVNGARSSVVERRAPESGAAAPAAGSGGEQGVKLPPKPGRASEFAIHLRDLPESAGWAYLQLTPPTGLPKLFGSALEPDLLSHLISVLSSTLSPSSPAQEQAKVLQYLIYLPRCARFEMIRLFLGEEDRGRVGRMLDRLGVGEGKALRGEWGV